MIERATRFVQEHPLETTTALVLFAGGAAYAHFRPKQEHDPGENYFDLIASIDQCFTEAGLGVPYVMLGGGASAALANPKTRLDVENRLMVPPPDIRKDQFRENGTLADVDILVMTADEALIDAVRAALEPDPNILNTGSAEERARELRKPGMGLKIGVTGLRDGDEYDVQPDSFAGKLLGAIKKDWVSHRLEYPGGERYFAISDVKVKLPDEYFEPWHAVLKGGERIPVLHPLVQVLCYLSRASHGIRRRDIEKVQDIMDNIGATFGAHLEFDEKSQTARLCVDTENSGVAAAVSFADQKNRLRWRHTRERLGTSGAAFLAAKIAVHRQLDTRGFFVQFGQGGWLFDNVISRFSGERQQRIEAVGPDPSGQAWVRQS